ncbi:hypothetical protein BDZ91DRAFT_791989 [Kalaharituber pfeilii]|nr:hypothetical protein BDZ91DRAFT_791989 [Kalaharituber pfeilii]
MSNRGWRRGNSPRPPPPPRDWEELWGEIRQKTGVVSSILFESMHAALVKALSTHNTTTTTTTTTTTPLGLSPITSIDTPPVRPTTEELGFSSITTCAEERPTPEQTAAPPPPTPDPRPENARNKKRKGKTPSPQDPYAIKRQLDDKEAKKVVSAPRSATPQAPRLTTPPHRAPSPLRAQRPTTRHPEFTPVPRPSPPPHHLPQMPRSMSTRRRAAGTTSTRRRTRRTRWVTSRRSRRRSIPGGSLLLLAISQESQYLIHGIPHRVKVSDDGYTTSKAGIVVHGIALRKDLGKVRRWLEAANKDLGKTTGIRWLRKDTLVNEGKKTSSAVVYLVKTIEVGRVRLGGRWLPVNQYEWDRGRKYGRRTYWLIPHPHHG